MKAAIALLTSATAVACDGRTTPQVNPDLPIESVFAVDVWPGEGIPVIVARRERLPLKVAPSSTAATADTMALPVGTRITFDSTRVETVASGLITTRAELRVTGRDLGAIVHLSRDRYYREPFPAVDEPVPARATIEYLQDRAEGTCFIRLGGRVIDADPCPSLHEHAQVDRPPVTRWWIHTHVAGGAAGWLIVSDSTAQSVRREF